MAMCFLISDKTDAEEIYDTPEDAKNFFAKFDIFFSQPIETAVVTKTEANGLIIGYSSNA